MQVTPLRPPPLPVAPAEAHWWCGQVTGVADQDFEVSLADGPRRARQALSCLVTPAVGDEVCLLETPTGDCYLTQVLHRPQPAPLQVAAPHGLQLHAEGPLSFTTSDRLSLTGEELEARFQRARWLVRLLECTGVEFLLRGSIAKLFTQAAELFSSRLQVGAERSYRHIGEAEHVRAGLLDLKAEHLVHIRGRNAILTAEQLAKIDGAQIHLG
jgi:hypothetical protein